MTATVGEVPAKGRELVYLPPDFHEVPLEPAREDRAAAQVALVEGFGLSEAAQRECAALFVEALARALADGPVLGTSFCAVRLHGAPSTATLTVATVHGPLADPLLRAAAVAETPRRRGKHGAVRVERAGRHVVAVAVGPQLVTAAVPVPGEPVVALLTVTTGSPGELDTYRQVPLGVAASLRVI